MSTDGFADRLRNQRIKHQLDQTGLAKRAGLSKSVISAFERGARLPSFENLPKLADALDVTADYLLGRVENTDDHAMKPVQMYRDLNNENLFISSGQKLSRATLVDEAEKQAYHDISNFVDGDDTPQEINITKMASVRGVEVIGRDLRARNVSGIFDFYGGKPLIVYGNHIRSLGHQRFSIAHELGHFCLPNHTEEFQGQTHYSTAFRGHQISDWEFQANAYASAVLMPKTMFEKVIESDGGIGGACAQFQASPVAMGLRYINLFQNKPALLIQSYVRGRGTPITSVDFAKPTKLLRDMDYKFTFYKEDLIPANTLTAELLIEGFSEEKYDDRECDIDVWFPDACLPNYRIREEVIARGKHATTLLSFVRT